MDFFFVQEMSCFQKTNRRPPKSQSTNWALATNFKIIFIEIVPLYFLVHYWTTENDEAKGFPVSSCLQFEINYPMLKRKFLFQKQKQSLSHFLLLFDNNKGIGHNIEHVTLILL